MGVRFKLDENIPGDAASSLRAAGHEVQSVVDEHLEGTPDAQLLDACRNESRLLITLDLDFADIRACRHLGAAAARSEHRNHSRPIAWSTCAAPQGTR